MGMELIFVAKKDYDKYYLNDGEYYNENTMLAYGRKSWGLFRYFRNITEAYNDEYVRVIDKKAFKSFIKNYLPKYIPMKIALKFVYWYEFSPVEPDCDSWVSNLYIMALAYFNKLVNNDVESDRDISAIINLLENCWKIRRVLKNDVVIMECSY